MSKMLQINNYNLNNLKGQYATLSGFSVDPADGSLVFENKKLNTNEIALDEIILMLDINDLRIFINNGFYTSSHMTESVNKIFDKMFITDDDYKLADTFTKDIVERIRLYTKYKTIFETNMESPSIKIFLKDTIEGKKLINEALRTADPTEKDAAAIIATLFEKNKSVLNVPTKPTPVTEVKQEEKELTRTLSNPHLDKFLADEAEYINDQNRYTTAGFTSLLAVISVILAFGVYLAVITIG